MVTCKDCVHYDVCNRILNRLEVCDQFKDKTRFVELPCKVYEVVKSPEKMTNYEYIRDMSVDEMAKLLSEICKNSSDCEHCPFWDNCPEEETCTEWEKWLKRSRDNA